MKRFILLAIGACVSLVATSLHAQPFSVTGHIVAGGGGTSSGSGFAISGTIAQAEATPRLQNGCWAIDPGFWGAYAAIQTPAAPSLRIRPISFSTVRVSFTPGCGDWVLQRSSELVVEPTPTVWIDDDPGNLVLVGDELVRDFHVPSWGPRLFFRLRKP